MEKNRTPGSGKDRHSSTDTSHAEKGTKGAHPNEGHELDRSRHGVGDYGEGRHNGGGYDASREDGRRHAPSGTPSRQDPTAQDRGPHVDSERERNEPDTSDQEHSAFDDREGARGSSARETKEGEQRSDKDERDSDDSDKAPRIAYGMRSQVGQDDDDGPNAKDRHGDPGEKG